MSESIGQMDILHGTPSREHFQYRSFKSHKIHFGATSKPLFQLSQPQLFPNRISTLLILYLLCCISSLGMGLSAVFKIAPIGINRCLDCIQCQVLDAILEPENLHVVGEGCNPVLLESCMLVVLLKVKINKLLKSKVLRSPSYLKDLSLVIMALPVDTTRGPPGSMGCKLQNTWRTFLVLLKDRSLLSYLLDRERQIVVVSRTD